MGQSVENQTSIVERKSFGIQYLRAWLALMVFFSHYCKAVNDPYILAFCQNRMSFIVDGAIAVAMFFALSGFFYYKTKPMDFISYMVGIKRKAFHIYPAHIVMLVIGMTLCNMHYHYDESYFSEWGNTFWNVDATWKDFIYGASCLLYTNATTKINPSAWYLEYEVWLFLIMPLIIGLINKIGWKYSWGLLLLGILGLVFNFEMYSIVNVVAVCCMGVLARYLTSIYEFNFLQNWKWLLIWLCVGILLLAHGYFGAGRTIMFLRGIGTAMIVIAFWKMKLPDIKWLGGLGNISFEFYLVQHIALLAFRPIFTNTIIYLILSLSTSIFVAWLLNSLVTRKITKLSSKRY